MPEYVYALFDFAPENPDEIQFKAGERIEVVERDDVYGDGWWQVSSSSIGWTSPFVSPGLCLRRIQTHGGEACYGCGGISRLLSSLFHPRRRACLRENVPLCLLVRSLSLPSFAHFRLAWNANLLLLPRVGQLQVVLDCFRKALPRRTSQSPLRHLRPSRFMNRNRSYIRLPPYKPYRRNQKTVP